MQLTQAETSAGPIKVGDVLTDGTRRQTIVAIHDVRAVNGEFLLVCDPLPGQREPFKFDSKALPLANAWHVERTPG